MSRAWEAGTMIWSPPRRGRPPPRGRRGAAWRCDTRDTWGRRPPPRPPGFRRAVALAKRAAVTQRGAWATRRRSTGPGSSPFALERRARPSAYARELCQLSGQLNSLPLQCVL
eukprot:scaffold8154_cov112-Isochrysis_galbana.AAC.2